jgi:hypothetical protein
MYGFFKFMFKETNERKHLFAGELVQIQEAIYRCRQRINQLGNDRPEQLSQEQENLHGLEERMRQVLKSYDSCTEEID